MVVELELDELLEDELVLVVSHGGEGAVGPAPVLEDELLPVPELLSRIPALESYQLFRTERSSVPMSAQSGPYPRARACPAWL
jgi:hypothetical protein